MVAGDARGRKLHAPRSPGTRPTSSRVREAIFDMLSSRLELPGLVVVDLFAGSGAMGIEALSRGAGAAVFVDRSPVALQTIQANLDALHLGEGGRARLVRRDALEWARWRGWPQNGRLPGSGWRLPLPGPAGSGPGPAPRRRIGVAICDPPYSWGHWEALLQALQAGLVVAESDREVGGPGWHAVRTRRYGSTVVTLLEPDRPAEPTQEERE